jgi:lipoprotein signal peptidase
VTALLVAGALAVGLDQASKGAVPARRRHAHRRRLYESAGGRAALAVTWLAALASSLVLCGAGLWFQSAVAQAGLGLALGGAAGNLLDVLRRGYVVDFIDVGWWPVFNVAEVGIVGGLLLAFGSAI